MPSLLNSPLDLIALRKAARDEVVAALDSVSSESKALVLDPALSGPLGLVARPLDFRAHGVDKIYHLESGPPPQGAGPLVYFVRAECLRGWTPGAGEKRNSSVSPIWNA